MSTNKKQVFISLDTARKMWKGLSLNITIGKKDSIRLFLLDNFTKEELEAKELPKSWEELKKIEGYYINTYSITTGQGFGTSTESSKNVFPTKELAEASLALAQLLQLRDVYNGDWKVDLNNRPNEATYWIFNAYNSINTSYGSTSHNKVLSFKSEDLRDQFAENFKSLIEIALPLL